MKTGVGLVGFSVLLGTIAAGCGDDNAAVDLSNANPDDLSAVEDMAVATDMTVPASPDLKSPCDADAGIPATLECAGLYDDFASKTVRAEVMPYAPGFELWSDGAKKSRFLYLPPGGKIDVTALNNWVFPIGTKLFKEFKLTVGSGDKRVETRMWWKRGVGDWVGVVYAWNDAETDAPRLETGAAAVAGTTYEIPAENRCNACHLARTDKPAGFEAVLLAAPMATGLTWAQLQTMNLVTSSNGNEAILTSALQIPGVATESAALGFLHANCGILCHQPGGPGPFHMNIDVSSGTAPATVAATKTYQQAVAISSNYKPPGAALGDLYYRLNPTEIARSTIRYRMSVRDALAGSSGVDQMPPLISHAVPTAGLAAIDAWITYMTIGNGYPAPGPGM